MTAAASAAARVGQGNDNSPSVLSWTVRTKGVSGAIGNCFFDDERIRVVI